MERTHSIDWLAPGECQKVVIDNYEIHVRLVERRGRRGRIAITAPAGATFIKQPATPRAPKGDADAGQR